MKILNKFRKVLVVSILVVSGFSMFGGVEAEASKIKINMPKNSQVVVKPNVSKQVVKPNVSKQVVDYKVNEKVNKVLDTKTHSVKQYVDKTTESVVITRKDNKGKITYGENKNEGVMYISNFLNTNELKLASKILVELGVKGKENDIYNSLTKANKSKNSVVYKNLTISNTGTSLMVEFKK